LSRVGTNIKNKNIMRKKDKLKNIEQVNLMLERHFVIERQRLVNSTHSYEFINACLESGYFNNDEKTYIVESIIPNTSLLTEGGWDWLKKNVFEPTKNAISKGVDTAKSFWDKIKSLMTNISNFLKKLWEILKKTFNDGWGKIKQLATKQINKSKDKLKNKLDEFMKLPPEKRDDEVEQIKLTADFWLTNGLYKILSNNQESVDSNINKLSSESPLKESWSPYVIDFMADKLVITENSKDIIKKVGEWLFNVIVWCLKGIVKLFEFVLSKASQGLLYSVSYLTKSMGGPGVYKFEHLSHLMAGILFTLSEALVLSSQIFDWHPHLGIIGDVIHTWEHILENVLVKLFGELPGIKTIMKVLTLVGILIGLYEIINAWKHFKKTHDNHTENTTTIKTN